jgi:hypothetical protein
MNHWELEPLDKNWQNWMVRYATAFQIGETAALSGDDSFVQDHKVTN